MHEVNCKADGKAYDLRTGEPKYYSGVAPNRNQQQITSPWMFEKHTSGEII